MARWIGTWEGEGVQDGRPIRDRMEVQWGPARRFLAFSYAALGGDGYRSQGFIWFDPEVRRYALYEFNNGDWPVRHHQGARQGNELRFEERTPSRHLRLNFRLDADGTLHMRESHVVAEQERPYVTLRFRRAAPGAEAPVR